MYKVLSFFFLSFIITNSNATFFEQGDACAGSRQLVKLANEFDAGYIYRGREGAAIVPTSQPIYDQLQNVDRNRQATTGDVEAVFKTILTLCYGKHLTYQPKFDLDLPNVQDVFLSAQFNAYKIMAIACEVLIGTHESLSATNLREQTVAKVRENSTLADLSDAYIAALVPDAVVTMMQGGLLGTYNREATLEALKAERETGKALYLVLGRGNRQPVPESRKTTGGKDIVWVYLDCDTRSHSVNRRDYFLLENFNDNLGSKLPENGIVNLTNVV